MFRFRTIIHILVFFFVFASVVFGLRWMDGYQAIQRQGERISFGEYVRRDIAAIAKGTQELKEIVQEARTTPDAVRTGQLNKLAQMLDLYRDEHAEYPETLEDLIGTLLDERSREFFHSDGLYYRKIFNGYELSILLDAGDRYTIRK
ncbi:hypothetical protein HYV71_04295 [Candidatus Uhrbacteria bacterium]|nr:hypothetical protein [Candidatus Uhrbacteria bacterium]